MSTSRAAWVAALVALLLGCATTPLPRPPSLSAVRAGQDGVAEATTDLGAPPLRLSPLAARVGLAHPRLDELAALGYDEVVAERRSPDGTLVAAHVRRRVGEAGRGTLDRLIAARLDPPALLLDEEVTGLALDAPGVAEWTFTTLPTDERSILPVLVGVAAPDCWGCQTLRLWALPADGPAEELTPPSPPGHIPLRLEALDGDSTPELVLLDGRWAYAFGLCHACSPALRHPRHWEAQARAFHANPAASVDWYTAEAEAAARALAATHGSPLDPEQIVGPLVTLLLAEEALGLPATERAARLDAAAERSQWAAPVAPAVATRFAVIVAALRAQISSGATLEPVTLPHP